MPWLVNFQTTTTRTNVGSVELTWTEPTGETFRFTDDQFKADNITQINNLKTRATTAKDAWKTKLDADKAMNATLTTSMNT